MRISDTNVPQAAADTRRSPDPASGAGDFQQRLDEAQNGVPATAPSQGASAQGQGGSPQVAASSRVSEAQYLLNGVEVSFDRLPAETQKWLAESDRKRAECEAYQARVADDPNVGAFAKQRPYDEAMDGWAMRRLAAMDPSTAHMTPQEYYNYAGSDREKYDSLVRVAQAPVSATPDRIFGVDAEQESRVQFVRETWSEGKELPNTFAEIEALWRAQLARQQDAIIDAEQLLAVGKTSKG